jgi:3,4-dihydroxy 2-butanone 4-phosphate synthase/GTP cyclohydrolase II
MDLLDAGQCGHSWPLPKALAALQQAERAAALLLNCGEDVQAMLGHLTPHDERAERQRGQMDLRTYGVGAQILRDLNISRMKILGNQRRFPSLGGYDLHVESFLPPQALR